MLHVFRNGLLASNTYLVWNEHDPAHPGFVLDFGVPAKQVSAFAVENGIQVRYLIASHGHYDHIHHINAYQTLFCGAPFLCHAEEGRVLSDSEANVSALCGDPGVYPQPDRTLSEGDRLLFGDGDCAMCWQVLHTPGHTPGCICLYNEKEKTMLTGDTLFADGGVGRCDFRYGDGQLLQQSLERLLNMDGGITIYPGHGHASAIREEKFYHFR
ncbi:MAG: MBL fold metallo-hydrolase [Eubacteriales bacterium]